jgi:shikimate dehydrogenase
MRLYGLIGYPLSHSFSMRYFTEKFAREGLQDCRYELFPVASIDDLSKILEHKDEINGLNVTIPYKRAVTTFLDESLLPEGLTACNCIKIVDHRLVGYNTDWLAFQKSLTPLLKPYHDKALVLGNGGAAEAVLYALRRMNIQYLTVSRHLNNGVDMIYADLKGDIIAEHRIIINTTPLGMFPDIETYPDIPYDQISSHHLLFDLVYNPAKTLFLEKGQKQGATIKNGEQMLILQAEESWKIWNS